MAHTLTFSGCYITVNSEYVSSGYELKNGDVLSLEIDASSRVGILGNATITINGTEYQPTGATFLAFSDTDLNIVYTSGSGFAPNVSFIIDYTETPRKSVDLTTLSGWQALSSGAHSIQLKAKASGYKDSELSQAVSVTKEAEAKIWGVSGLGNSNPTLTRTFDNVGKTYNINSSAGTITTDFDTEFNFETVVQDGNTMIKIPTFYKRFDTITDNQITAFSISKTKVNDDFIPYPCFVKQDGSGDVMPYILISKGKATGTSSKATCVSGAKPLVNLTRAQARTAARANGTGWQQFDWMMVQLIRDLFCVVFATTNSQSIFLGRTTGFSEAASVGGTWNISTPCGWNTSTMQNRFFGVEDIFGNVNDWCDGVTFSDSTVYSTVNPSLFSDSTSNMINSGTRPTSNGYVNKLNYSAAQPFMNYVSTASGSNNTYYADKSWYNSGNAIVALGGAWDNGVTSGLWCLFGEVFSFTTYSTLGMRLIYRPQ